MDDYVKDFDMVMGLKDLKIFVLLNKITNAENKERLTITDGNIALLYILKELMDSGEFKDINPSNLCNELNVREREFRRVIELLVNSGFVIKYKKVKEIYNAQGKPTGKYRKDKVLYSLVLTNELLELFTDVGYTPRIDKDDLTRINDFYIEETRRLTNEPEKEIQKEDINDNDYEGLDVFEILLIKLKRTEDKKEQVILIHNTLREGNQFTTDVIKKHNFRPYIDTYNSMCLGTFATNNSKAKTKFKLIPEEPMFSNENK